MPENRSAQESRVDWLSLLNQLSQSVNLASENIHKTLDLLMARLVEEIDIDAIAIWTIEKNTDLMMIYSSVGLSDRYIRFFNKTDRIRVGKGLVGRVLNDRVSMAVANLSGYEQIGIPRWSKMLEEEGIVSVLAVPMFVGGKILGSFNVYYTEEHHYSDQEKLFTEILANQIAMVIDNEENLRVIRSNEESLRKQVRKLLDLQDVTQFLNLRIAESVHASVEPLYNYVQQKFQASGIAIFEHHEPENTLYLAGSYGLSERDIEFFENRPLKVGKGSLSGNAFLEKKPQISFRVFTDERIHKDLRTLFSISHHISAGAFPLTARERAIGVLVVFYDFLHEFSEEEIGILSMVSQFLGVSLENIKTFQSLALEKQKTQSMVYSLQDGLVVYDLDNNIIDINPRGEILLGVKKSEMLGKSPHMFENEKGALKNVFNTSVALIDDFHVREIAVSNPPTVALEVMQVPLRDESNRKTGSMRILHDITPQKNVERLQSSFVSTASHQLRTPLTGIKWGLDDLITEELGTLNNEQKTLIKKIAATNENMIFLLNDLLDVSRIEEGRFEYSFEKGSVAELIEQIVKESEINTRERKLNMQVKKSDSLPQASFDKEKLRIALRNIIDNAIQYTYPGGTIEVKIDAGSEFLFITISDTGIGIPKDETPFIFHKFFRARNAVLTRTEGSGLGLYISKSIISNHNGKITFESKENKGTTFLIGLPIKEELMPKGRMQEATILS